MGTPGGKGGEMMTYKVTEKRVSIIEYEIEAESEADAKALSGDILDETETDNYAYEIISCEEIGDGE
jgi:hypothetical protein